MKVVKILLAVVGVLVLVVVAGIAIVMATFDPARYKPELVALVKEKTGRTLAIEGPIGLSVFPKLGVSIGKTQLSEAGSDKTFARLGEARVSLALLPLLSGQVSGPFDALKYNIEFGSAATAAVKQQVQEKVKEQVQDRLKGLLRR